MSLHRRELRSQPSPLHRCSAPGGCWGWVGRGWSLCGTSRHRRWALFLLQPWVGSSTANQPAALSVHKLGFVISPSYQHALEGKWHLARETAYATDSIYREATKHGAGSRSDTIASLLSAFQAELHLFPCQWIFSLSVTSLTGKRPLCPSVSSKNSTHQGRHR